MPRTVEPERVEREFRALRRSARVRTAAQISAVLVPLLALLLAIGLDPWSETRQLRGTVVGLHEAPSRGQARQTLFLFKISDGRTVKVLRTGGVRYHQDQQVIVSEQRSRFLRRIRHVLVSLVAEETR